VADIKDFGVVSRRNIEEMLDELSYLSSKILPELQRINPDFSQKFDPSKIEKIVQNAIQKIDYGKFGEVVIELQKFQTAIPDFLDKQDKINNEMAENIERLKKEVAQIPKRRAPLTISIFFGFFIANALIIGVAIVYLMMMSGADVDKISFFDVWAKLKGLF